jgi:hypothetical protein
MVHWTISFAFGKSRLTHWTRSRGFAAPLLTAQKIVNLHKGVPNASAYLENFS